MARRAGKTFIFGGNVGNATLIAHGGTNGGAGGAILFEKYGSGGTARVQLDGNGFLDISILKQPNLRVGSVEGDGEIFLGENNLGIGTNNLSTQLEGVVQDGGRHNRKTGGSLTKVGTGILTLTGANTYTGGTTITGGVLRVNNTEGSGTGTGDVQVDLGTPGGKGTLAGAVTVGTGSGAGAYLAPSVGASTLAQLTIQSALTFKADGTYTYKLNTRKAKADQVIGNAVTIESGAQFDFQPAANERLTHGTAFIVINYTAATAISGEFSNLPDGSTFTSGRNSFQVDYQGGRRQRSDAYGGAVVDRRPLRRPDS